MANRNSRFTKGSSTFTCTSCGHLTRNTGDQAVDAKVCPICWDLAGYENMEQDGDMTDADGKFVTSLFLELKAKRTPEQYAKALRSCDLLEAYFPAEGEVAEKVEVKKIEMVDASTVMNPVALCKALFAANPDISRKDFVKVAVGLGVLKATASTQYNRIKKGA